MPCNILSLFEALHLGYDTAAGRADQSSFVELFLTVLFRQWGNTMERVELLEERLIELESRSAYQDELIHGLSEEIARQRADAEIMRTQMKHILDMVKERGAENGVPNTADERPPHY